MECHPDEIASSRTLGVQGGHVHYHDLGRGEPLLLLPAYGPLPGTTAWLTFAAIIKALSQRFRCILLDYPNFGRSSPMVFNEPIHDLYVRHAIAVLDHLGIEKTKVLGLSTGGTVAIDLVLTAPERVSRMVVGGCEASTGGDPYLLSPWPSEVARLASDCQFNPPEVDRIRRLLTSLVYDPEVIPADLATAMYEWRLAEPAHADSWARSTSTPTSQLGRLSTIQTPMLIIHGRFDRMVPLEGAIRLLNHLPTADLVVLNRCGHWPTVERPGDYLKCALQFL